MMKRSILILMSGCALAGCATTSFSPPGVQVNYVGEPGGSPSCAQASQRQGDRAVTVERDVNGALRVVETYIDAYDCSAREAANGRQGFELPAFIATTGAAIAVAFGGGADFGIAGTAANSVFNAGKAYYDPKQKAVLYAHALDALRCIRTEAVGIDNFAMFKAASDGETMRRVAGRAAAIEARSAFLDPPSVSVSGHQQYFVMVTDAVGAVSGILTDRLSDVGSFNPKGTADEIKRLIDEIRAAEKAEEDAKKNPPPTTDAEGVARSATEMALAREAWRQTLVDLDLKALQKKLQECIWRAKV